MKNKKKIAILFILLLISASTIFFARNDALKKLVALGYSEKYSNELLKNTFQFNKVVKNEENRLNVYLEENTKYVKDVIGFNEFDFTNKNLVSKNEIVLDYKKKEDQLKAEVDSLLIKAKKYEIDYNKEETLLNKINDLKTIITNKEVELSNQINVLTAEISNVERINAVSTPDLLETKNNLENLKNTIKEEIKKENVAFLDDDSALIFEMVNTYRSEQGLAPYVYNSEKQACLNEEATYYSDTKNPHGWVCASVANENAGIAGINSNYTKLAVDFWKSSPSHNVVLLGIYKSVTISVLKKDGVVYMELGVFY